MALAPTLSSPTTGQRLASIDLLRGLVIVIMALDHTRDYVHWAAMEFPPENLARTSAAIFLTRWITHFCAPVFMFCSGLGAYLWLQRRGGTTGSLSCFLLTRGVWLVVLEFTIVRAGFFFHFDYDVVLLLVFWALGMSMIVLAGLVHLPFRALLAVSVALILLHNFTDGVRAAELGGWEPLWRILHQPGPIQTGGPILLVAYPLIPWVGVMALGYCFGRLYELPAERRARLLVWTGIVLSVAFVVVRVANVYGDPRPWMVLPSPLFTLLSFLNTTKYPPSLSFLLMTLGPAIALLGWIDRARPREWNPLLVFGRVPLFFFVLHIPVIHAAAVAMTYLRYGAASFLFTPPPTLGTPRDVFPADYGWSLGATYVLWLGVVVALYPLCAWFARYKARSRSAWVSYL